MTVSEAAKFAGVTTPAIRQQIWLGEKGAFPGAFLVTDVPRPFYRIPSSEVIAYKQKRDQAKSKG